MADNRETNFISAVVYLQDDAGKVVPFFAQLCAQLDTHFENYELIAVNDGCADDTVKLLREWAGEPAKAAHHLNMSLRQGLETAMNAGLDAAIGDFSNTSFDSLEMQYDADPLFWQAHQKGLSGFDVVTACPDRQKSF